MNRDTFSILLGLADRRRLVVICALAVVGALTEGLGFILLVPLLGLFIGTSGEEEASVLSPVTNFFERVGWQPDLATLLAAFAVLVAVRAASDYARVIISMRQSIMLVDGMRGRAISALLGADWRVLSRMRQSENRAMLLSEIDRAGIAVEQFAALTRIVIGLGVIGLAAFAIAPVVALGGIVLGLLVFALYGGLRKRAHRLGQDLGLRLRKVHGLLEENLNALRAIKSFGREDQARDSILSAFQSLRETRIRFAADAARARGFLQTGAAVLVAVLVWLALSQWNVAAIAVLPLVALFARALPQLSALLDTWNIWAHSSPAIVAAHNLIAEAEAAAERTAGDLTALPPLTNALHLENVSLSHRQGVATLQDVSLELRAGELVALIGPSGAGKSTLADIAGGLLAPDQGQVVLDGTVLDAQRRHCWRQQVAYVDQSPSLFDGSVRDNLLWAAPAASEQALESVLRQAAAHFVFDLPGGLDCQLGEGGRQLSGGERQRIVLARALLREPSLLILDEATSALDAESDTAVAQAIAALEGQRTILIIGHRGALTELAQRRIVIDTGRIVTDVRGHSG